MRYSTYLYLKCGLDGDPGVWLGVPTILGDLGGVEARGGSPVPRRSSKIQMKN